MRTPGSDAAGRIKTSAKRHLMNAVTEATNPALERTGAQIGTLEEQVAAARREATRARFQVEELQTRLERLEELRANILQSTSKAEELRESLGDVQLETRRMSESLAAHLPRAHERPTHLARFNIADALAWRAAVSSAAFIEEHMGTAEVSPGREDHLRMAARLAPPDGVILEMGVGRGDSLRWLVEERGDRRVVGFDSFEGLPEDWRTGFGTGYFSDVQIPEVAGAELVVGWFADTIPSFMDTLNAPISLLHVDCDLYSSSRTVLDHCLPRMAAGSIVVFDEFFNYPGWESHEARAWREALAIHPARVEYLAYVPSWEQVSAKVWPAEEAR